MKKGYIVGSAHGSCDLSRSRRLRRASRPRWKISALIAKRGLEANRGGNVSRAFDMSTPLTLPTLW